MNLSFLLPNEAFSSQNHAFSTSSKSIYVFQQQPRTGTPFCFPCDGCKIHWIISMIGLMGYYSTIQPNSINHMSQTMRWLCINQMKQLQQQNQLETLLR